MPTISSVTAGWGTFLNATEDNSPGTVTVLTSGAENDQTVTVALNGTNYTGTVSDNSTSVTFAATGLQALTDGSNYTLTTNVSDAAGNAATVNTGTSFTYDITAPTISGGVAITSATGIQNNLLNAGDVVSVTATFSESIIVDNTGGSPTLSLVVGSTNRTATYTSGSGSTSLVFQYTIQAGESDSDGINIGANALALNSSTISDPAGNIAILTHSAISDNNSYKVDTTAPTVNSFTISDSLLTVGETATVDLVFSEAVFGFASAADIADPSGTLAAMTSSDNITWTGTFTPTANTEEASNTLSLATSWTDLAGNGGPSETTPNYAIDTLAPVSSIVISSATGIQNNFLNAGDSVSVTATFNESVTVDTASGTPTLTLVVGSTDRTATYTSGSGSTSLVFQYTIQAGETDDNGISIEANVLALNSSTIKDAVLNNANLTHSAVSANSNYKVDTTLPTVSSVEITSATGMLNNSLNAGDVVSVTATFNEIVIRTGSPQLTIVVGSTERTATYTSGSGSTLLVFQYTIQAGETDDNGISIGADVLALNSGTIRDRAGHNATLTHSAVSANTSYKVDTTAPTVNSFTISDSLLTVGETATVDLVFSEAVFGFASAADITDPSGTLAAMTSSDNINWTGTFTPTANTEEASNTLSLATSWTDLAGNAGPSETTPNYEVETKAPTGSFTFTDYHFKLGDNATVTLVFSEVVVGFSSDDDIMVPNLDNGTTSGTLAAMISNDNKTWYGTFTPTFPNTQDWTNTLSLATSYTDTVGNTGTVAESENYMVDDIDPSTNGVPTLTLNRSLLLYGQTATLTLVFPEPVTSTSFSSTDDINLDNATGSLSTMSPNDNKTTWTGTFTPTTGREVDNNTITLADSWTDQVGNPGTAATTSNFEVETLAPSANSFTLSDTELKAGDNATVTLVFSEVVVGFSSDDDIMVPNLDNGTTSGTLAAMISNDNKTWAGIFTPTANTENASTTLSLDTSYTDTAGNTGIAGTSSSYVVDTKGPSVSSLQLSDGVTTISTFTDRCIPVTSNIMVTFSEAMETSYITTSTSDTNCAGSILVSSDNFSSCVRMSSEPSASNSNQTFTLDPYDNLSFYTTYKVRVTTGVKDVLGNNISSQYDNSIGVKTSSYPSSSPISGVFVGVGQYGKAIRSIDNGGSWDNETCQILTDLNGVTSGNNTFVAVGDNGIVLRSTDNASSFSSVSPYYTGTSRGVTFGNNTFLGVSDGGKTGRSIDNASSWNNSTSGISTTLYGVTFGNNTFVAVGQSGKILRSTDNASSWNNSTSPITTDLNGVTFSE